jgi:hypothetical protein
MANPSSRDDLPGFLRDLDKRTARQERHSHHGVGSLAPPSGMLISADHGNRSLVGDDGGAYTREIVAAKTAPGPFEFGGHLVTGSVWLQWGAEEPVCIPWVDDFERADGAVGTDWVTGPGPPWHPVNVGSTVVPLFIDDGAAVGVPNGTPETYSGMHWHEEQEADQFIEVEVENAVGNNGYILLQTNCNASNSECVMAEFNFYDDAVGSSTGELFILFLRTHDPTHWGYYSESVSLAYPAEPMTLGFQSTADGVLNAYVNGAVVLTMTTTWTATGPFVGMSIQPEGYLGSPYTSMRILSATGGCPT